MHTRGRGADTSKYVRKKVPFYMYFVIFSYGRYLFHSLLPLVKTFTTVL